MLAPSISPDALASLQGTDGAPLLLDVRRQPAFDRSDRMLAGARHCPPELVAQLAAREPRRDVVVYCVYGHGVSQQAAAELNAAGWQARWLEGGFDGGEDGVDAPEDCQRWRAAPLRRVPKQPPAAE